MPNLKKTVYFAINGEEIALDVTWDLLEKVERVYSLPCDLVPYILQEAARVPRSKVAEVVALWVQGKTKQTKDEIKEFYFTCPQIQYIKDIGKIQAALLWSLRNEDGTPTISDKAFDALVNGQDITEEEITPPTPVTKAAGKGEKKPRVATSKKRTG